MLEGCHPLARTVLYFGVIEEADGRPVPTTQTRRASGLLHAQVGVVGKERFAGRPYPALHSSIAPVCPVFAVTVDAALGASHELLLLRPPLPPVRLLGVGWACTSDPIPPTGALDSSPCLCRHCAGSVVIADLLVGIATVDTDRLAACAIDAGGLIGAEIRPRPANASVPECFFPCPDRSR